jgi:3-phosphoshikimate 1-carboxyvinyltransferase
MRSFMKDVIVKPAKNIVGSIRLPGDKSISHRYGMLAAIAEGTTRLRNFSTGADCASTLACMRSLGALVSRSDGEILIEGCSGKLTPPASPLDCGNSGSTMRMLSGILAGQPFESELIGDASLSRRPMRRIIEPLTKMGATFSAQDGHAPLKVRGGNLSGISYEPPVASAQVKTSLLFAGLFAHGETAIEEPLPTRDHGEVALRAFGAQVEKSKARVSIKGGQRLKGIEATVPGDISSAAFFLCAAALFPDSNLVIDSLLLNPSRAVLLDVLVALGVRVRMIQVEEKHGELSGTITVESGPLKGVKLAGAQSAALIDEVPVLAAIAPYTRDGIVVRDARELRVKESDRIAAVARNLRAMGAEVIEFEDGLSVPGGQKLHGAEIDSEHDHRIAMAFAIAALRAEGDTVIHGADAAQISFPEFFAMLEGVAER